MADHDELLADVRYCLEQAHVIYKKFYDKHHREVHYKVGDWMWLRLRHHAPSSLQVPVKGKLKPRFYGPYHVAAIINDVAYCLDLPPSAQLHDVFHMGLLKKFFGAPPEAPPPLTPTSNGAVVLEPEQAVRARLAHGVRQVLVRSKGEPATSATWEDIDSFIARYPSF